MATVKHFRRGSSTFPCNVCGRLTRDTGAQSMGNKICPQCYDLAGLENEVSDGHKTQAEAAADALPLIVELEAKSVDAGEWRATFGLEGGR